VLQRRLQLGRPSTTAEHTEARAAKSGVNRTRSEQPRARRLPMAWILGMTVREHRDRVTGRRMPDFETVDRIDRLFA
jgi:hypothetical protein